MLGDKAWLALQFIPNVLDGDKANQVLPYQTQKTISLWTWRCAWGHCHDEIGKSPN